MFNAIRHARSAQEQKQLSALPASTASLSFRTASAVVEQASSTTQSPTDANLATHHARPAMVHPGRAACRALKTPSSKETKPAFVTPDSTLRRPTPAQPATTPASHASEQLTTSALLASSGPLSPTESARATLATIQTATETAEDAMHRAKRAQDQTKTTARPAESAPRR